MRKRTFKENILFHRKRELIKKLKINNNKESKINNKESKINNKESKINNKENIINNKENIINIKENIINNKENTINNVERINENIVTYYSLCNLFSFTTFTLDENVYFVLQFHVPEYFKKKHHQNQPHLNELLEIKFYTKDFQYGINKITTSKFVSVSKGGIKFI